MGNVTFEEIHELRRRLRQTEDTRDQLKEELQVQKEQTGFLRERLEIMQQRLNEENELRTKAEAELYRLRSVIQGKYKPEPEG